ncbi:NRDE family protein [Flagellimonas sp. DF-77]|uniref:NRDE family protein n=1 Tax=Flagellimonas algarum TaxID=3230298 RepID=UPI0033949797
MCTVSYIKNGPTVLITSNRDEHIMRKNALAPAEQDINGKKVVFPKDPKAGGSWFAVAEDGAVVVLLNGAFEKHVSSGPYRKSRGLVVLDVASQEHRKPFLKSMELEGIEPFTLLVYEQGALHELRWDGLRKTLSNKDIGQAHIWSSATLYDPETIAHREGLFEDFLDQGERSAAGVIAFHSSDNGDSENGFIIDRKTGLKTFSVTQAIISQNTVTLDHHDLLNAKTYRTVLDGQQLEPTN